MKNSENDTKLSSSRWWVLLVLTLIYSVNFLDRTIVGVLAQPIKDDLGLSDFQLGLLGGLAFALTYTLIGIPVARLSERVNRVKLMSVAVVVWSMATIACAAAANFVQLLLFRAGVGVGEAGCTPPAHSIISDTFPASSRAFALSLFQLGAVIGMAAGAVLGGMIAHDYGWRVAMVCAGLPGLVLAALLWFTVRDPARGQHERPGTDSASIPSLFVVARHMIASPTARNVLIGGTIVTFVAYGVNHFTPALLSRKFDLDTGQAGAAFAIIVAGSAVGVLSGGFLADRLSRRDRRWLLWIPTLALGIGAPLQILGFQQDTLLASLIMLGIGTAFTNAFIGPQFATFHNILSPRMRATAISIVLLCHSLIGLGLGAPFAGGLSDYFAREAYLAGGNSIMCLSEQGVAPTGACAAASAYGLALALSTLSCLYVVAAAFLAVASRTLRRELIDQPSATQHS